MQAYGAVFARVYNERWAGFVQQVAPTLHDFYVNTPLGQQERSLLDLCCGTGQLARYFLERGFHVTGVDLSEAMLAHARDSAAPYVENGQARFFQADAADFTLSERFGLVVSTYDALNHLPDETALRGCFRCAHAVTAPGGTFLFDLNTRAGLLERWNSISVIDTEEVMIVTRGIYDGLGERAWTKISGFARTEGGTYERFDETVYNTVFGMEAVRAMLLESGWSDAHCARLADLTRPIEEPEKERRVFFVARKGGTHSL